VIIVVLKNPDPLDPIRKGTNVEVRIMIEGMNDREAAYFGEAINKFAQVMGRRQGLDAFKMEDDLVVR
jgi:hypothetical protein